MESPEQERKSWREGGREGRRNGVRGDWRGREGWILNQRRPPVTPSGVPPSGHIPKIATGAVSSAKPPASGLQPACECEISMGIVGHNPMSAAFFFLSLPPPPPPPHSLPFFSLPPM